MFDQRLPATTIQAGSLDLGGTAALGPKQQPKKRKIEKSLKSFFKSNFVLITIRRRHYSKAMLPINRNYSHVSNESSIYLKLPT